MGIFRSAPLEVCAGEFGTAPRSEKFAPFAMLGIDAASRPVPVAVRNFLRSMLDDLRRLFMRSPQLCRRLRSPHGSRAALYDAFCRDELCDSLRFERSNRRNRGRHGELALRRTLFLLNRLHKHFDGLSGVRRNKNGRGKQSAAHLMASLFASIISALTPSLLAACSA